jgi:hypothetical protein
MSLCTSGEGRTLRVCFKIIFAGSEKKNILTRFRFLKQSVTSVPRADEVVHGLIGGGVREAREAPVAMRICDHERHEAVRQRDYCDAKRPRVGGSRIAHVLRQHLGGRRIQVCRSGDT